MTLLERSILHLSLMMVTDLQIEAAFKHSRWQGCPLVMRWACRIHKRPLCRGCVHGSLLKQSHGMRGLCWQSICTTRHQILNYLEGHVGQGECGRTTRFFEHVAISILLVKVYGGGLGWWWWIAGIHLDTKKPSLWAHSAKNILMRGCLMQEE